jgi:hypothetical protein
MELCLVESGGYMFIGPIALDGCLCGAHERFALHVSELWWVCCMPAVNHDPSSMRSPGLTLQQRLTQ